MHTKPSLARSSMDKGPLQRHQTNTRRQGLSEWSLAVISVRIHHSRGFDEE